jgi:hypothetical protein
MSNDYLQEKVRAALNQELIRRLLNRYFVQKGYNLGEDFDKKIYPPILQDMPVQIPQMLGKLEVEPYAEDINPNTGVYKLGWNLYVLGNQRMSLGFSTHANLSEVRTAIAGPMSATSRGTFSTPRRIVNFITKVLSTSKQGDIASMPKNLTVRQGLVPYGTGEMSGYFRTSHRPVF